MSSQDIIGRANTAELDVVLGTAKEAARIPLPPSLSLTSTASASVASASVKTEYLSKKSDSRDETHHADVVVDISMREGAEVMSELPRSRSNMSALSSKSSMEGEPKVQSRTSSNVVETDSMNEAPMLSSSLSKISHKSSVEASPSLEAVPSKLSTSHSLTSKASNASLRKGSGSKAEVDQVSLGVPNSMSLSSQKSSKGGSVKGIPLALTKSRSTQSSKSGSIHQKHSLTSTTVSMSRSTSSSNSKVPVVEGTHGDSPVEMPVSHSNSMQSLEAVPSKLSTSNSMTSKASLRSLKSKASNVSLRKGSGSQAEGDQVPLGLPNSMSLNSQKSSKSKGGSVKGIPLVPKLSTSNSLTSKASNASLGKGSVSQEEGDQVPLGLPNSMSLSSHKSSKGGSVKGIPLALTKSRSTQSSKSGSSKQLAVNNTLSHSTSTTVSMSRSTSSTISKVPVEGTYGDSPVVMSSPSLEAVPSKLSTSHSLTSKASNASLRKGSASHAEVDQVSLDVPKSMSLSSQKSSKVGSVNGIPLALTKSRSTQSSNSRSSKQQEAAAAKSISPTSTAVSMSRSTSSTNPKNISPTVGNTVTASTTVSMSRSTSSTNSKHISSTVGNTVTARTTATSPASSPASTAVSMSRSTSSTNSKGMPTSNTVSMSRSTSNSNIPMNGMRAAMCSLVEMPVTKSNSVQALEVVKSSDSKNETAGEAVATPSSSKLVTALSGNVLWRIMNGQMPGEESLEDESPMPPAVHPTVSTSSSKESPEERAAAGLPPRACAAVAEAEDKSLAAQVEMKLSQEDDRVKESTSTLTERAGNRKLREAEEAIWDNSIEVSFSDMGTVMDKKSSSAEEAPTVVEEGDEEAVGDSSTTPVDDAPRKKGKWSSKLKKIFSGKSGSTNVAVKEKKEKSTSLRKRFQKKKLDKKEHQGEDTTLLGETADNTTEVQEPIGEGILGEFAWAIEYVSTGNMSEYASTESISGEVEKEEDAALNEPELEAAGETSALVVPTVDCPVSDKSAAALDNHVLCSKPEWDEAMCNFQEVKEAMFALAGKWSWTTNNPKEEGWVIPQTPLDKNKGTVIFAAAKQLYSQRELIKEKSADLKEQEKLAHEAQNVTSYQAALEKSGLLVKELSDAKIMEDVSFKSVKTLFNSLTKQERGYAVMLGDDVARAAKEVEALNCDAVVEVELRLPEA